MKKKPILFPLLLIVLNGTAQESAPTSALKTIPELRKNEISVNTAPAFRILMNAGSVDATRFSFAYKRYLNEHSALRISIVADIINPEANRYSPIYPGDVIIMQSNDVMVKQVVVSSPYVSPHLNLGYERLFGKRKLKWFYGADLAVGYSRNKSFTQNQTFIRDTSQGANTWVEAQTFNLDIVKRTSTETFSVGISPFFGAKYPISKRFSISAQVGFDASVKNQYISEEGFGVHQDLHVTSFDFDERTGVLNDISLIYKF